MQLFLYIFFLLKDEGYSQISRTKRTDNNTNATTEGEVEEEFSGGGSLDQIGKYGVIKLFSEFYTEFRKVSKIVFLILVVLLGCLLKTKRFK